MRSALQSGLLFLIAVCAAIFILSTEPVVAQQRHAFQTKATAPAGLKTIGRMPASQQLDLAISLPLRNQDQLSALLQQLEDPKSPNYHRYLTLVEFTEKFSPTPAQYEQIIAFAQANGLRVTHTSANRTLVNASGPVSSIERAFQVRMQVYQHPTADRTFFAPDVAPTVGAELPILSVSGLTNFALPHSLLKHAPADAHGDTTGSGSGGQFYGSDFRAAYYGNGPLTGSGQALALAELGQWNMADVQAYFSAVGQPLNVPIVLELLGGTSAACPGACDDGEEVNDIIQIISMAPGAPVLIVYQDTTGNADIDIFNAYATENISKQMSFSFGIGDGNAAADEQAFQEFHAQGQNFFVASGDEGANLGDGGWPGYSQNVTDVGGTDLTTAGADGAWASETGWVGSGTGWCDSSNSNSPCYKSAYDAIPSYQSPVITPQNGGSTKYRNLPDVSAEANTDSFWCAAGTCQGGLGGTSLAAPRWAGFLALANEQAAANGETVGFLNPLVYTLGQGSGYDTAFHDITSGSNPSGSTVPPGFTGSFTAATGFDMVTGWGTPNGQGMIDALAPASTTNPYFTLAASPSTLNLTPGGAPMSTSVSLATGNGFAGIVALSATIIGNPTGVTASFSPTSISGSDTSTLTVTTTSSTPAGTLMLTVVGTSAGGIQTQPAFVTLALPDFSLSVSPSTIYLNQSGTATPTVSVDSQNNFSGTVNLAVSALPNGVTGSFSPASTSSTSTLTLAASSTAATVGGDYLTVSGTSGGITPLNAPYTILAVSAATGTGGSGTPVNLSSAYNLNAIYADGTTFSSTGGLDGAGSAYSSNLLTPNRILSGVQFNFGPANASDAVSGAGQTISLPAGQFTTLQLLATGIDGPILSQAIKVTYTDSSTTTITQSFSDWCGCSTNPGQQSGEAFAVVMPYRDSSSGAKDERQFNLYGYTLVLDSSKTVQSFTLPNNRDVIVLAATLSAQSLGTQVSLASQYNTAGLYNTGITFPATGGMDGGGNGCTLPSGCADGYSAQQMGLPSTTPPALNLRGLLYDFGPVNTTDCTTACLEDMINLSPGVTVSLPGNQQTAYTTLNLLGTAVQGSHNAKITVNYTSGAASVFNQTFSDWCSFGHNANESVAVGGMDRINSDGTLQANTTCNLYAYTYALDSSRTLESIALANADSPKTNFSLVLALTLSGNVASAPSYTLSASPSTVSLAQGGNGTSTITVNPTDGFTGSVSLAASGLPSGVTASFSPTSTTGTSTLTLTASGTATVGALNITVTGTSGSIVETTTVALTVTPPASFTLSAPSTLNVAQSASSAATITVDPANGFTGTVSLSASGLPVGVTAAFNPTSTTGSSTLTFTAISTATTGAATITVTGTSGVLTETALIDLTVMPPATYSLSAGAPTPATVSPGGSSQATVTVASTNGYTGSVTLSCSISPVVSSAPTCSFGSTSPVAVTSSGGSATLTFKTVPPSASAVRPALFVLFLPLPALVLLGAGFGARGSRRKKLLGLFFLWLVVAGLLIMPACGGGGNGGGGGNTNPGTPAGTYTITISGTDANSATQNNTAPAVTVVVN